MSEPIGLSTAWNGPGANPASLIAEARALGFRRLEAYAHFGPEALLALKDEATKQDVEIASMHSPCPVPPGTGGFPLMLGDSLASTTASERTRAVDAHLGTIDAAVALGAKGIVIHLGNSGAVSRQSAIFDVIARNGRLSDDHLRLRDEAWREREAVKGPRLEAALTSIRTLGEHARGSGLQLGIECRDGYHETPSLDEFADVFAACEGLPVGYWHDAGHGAKLDYLGFVEHEEFLRRYGDRLVGMHIHDFLNGRDHLAPGQGTTDFAMLARYLKPETVRTLELSRSVASSDITHALDVLEPLGVYGISEGILIST